MKKTASLLFTVIISGTMCAQVTSPPKFSDDEIDENIGRSFYYNNVAVYKNWQTPYPYVEGRLRAGKYISSSTAFNNYMEQWKSYKNKVFKFIGRKTIDVSALYSALGINGIDERDLYLFESEEKDTFCFNNVHGFGKIDDLRTDRLEFWSVEFLDYLHNTMLNKEYVYLGCPFLFKDDKSRYANNHSLKAKKLSSGEQVENLPLLKVDNIESYSIWKVKDIQISDGRLYATLNSKIFGDYQVLLNCFEEYSAVGVEIDKDNYYNNLFCKVFIHKEEFINSIKSVFERIRKEEETEKKLDDYKEEIAAKYREYRNSLDFVSRFNDKTTENDLWDEEHKKENDFMLHEKRELEHIFDKVGNSIFPEVTSHPQYDKTKTEWYKQFLRNFLIELEKK